MDEQSVAESLYSLPAGEFTAARDAQAAQARKAGDAELATAIKKLRRPTAGAALMNLLVRERRDDVAALIDLGENLRKAQEDLAADELRELSQQRRTAIGALVTDAKDLAKQRGEQPTDAVLGEVRATLEAASADASAAEELRAGRLTKALQYSGFGGGMASVAPRTSSSGRPPPPPKRVEDLDARRALRDAGAAAQRAQDELTAAEHAVSEARLRTEDRRRAVIELEEQLLSAREALTVAKRELTSAQHSRASAERACRSAQDALHKAERAVKGSSGGSGSARRGRDGE